jgi:hypothetical protein
MGVPILTKGQTLWFSRYGIFYAVYVLYAGLQIRIRIRIRIRINLSCWIRIRIQIADPDPDPGGQK